MKNTVQSIQQLKGHTKVMICYQGDKSHYNKHRDLNKITVNVRYM